MTLINFILPRYKFDGAALTIFSVNSFLYGFYISPILGAQKTRIEELHKIIRSEANALFAIVLSTKELPQHLRNELQDMFADYLKKTIRHHNTVGEKAYEEIITYLINYNGMKHEEVDKILEKVVANQQNRTMFNMQINNKVFSNEWMIMFMLFSITLSFILLLDTGDSVMLSVVAALLCTGLSMLILILVKLSTLTHKKAKQMWQPFQKLIDSRFYRLD